MDGTPFTATASFDGEWLDDRTYRCEELVRARYTLAEAQLLYTGGACAPLRSGEVVVTTPGQTNRVENTGDGDFVCPTVPTPPEDMTNSYDGAAPGQEPPHA